MKDLDSHLNIRVSKSLLDLIKTTSKRNKITRSKLIRMAIEMITDEEILEYQLQKAGYKKP